MESYAGIIPVIIKTEVCIKICECARALLGFHSRAQLPAAASVNIVSCPDLYSPAAKNGLGTIEHAARP